MIKSPYYAFLFILCFLKFFVVFVESLPNQANMPKLPIWSASKYYQEKNCNKTISYSYSHHPPAWTPSLWHWYTRVSLQICNSSPSNPTTFLVLQPLLPQWLQVVQFPTSIPNFNASIMVHGFTIYGHLFKQRLKKLWYLTKSNLFDAGLILTSLFVECVRHSADCESKERVG